MLCGEIVFDRVVCSAEALGTDSWPLEGQSTEKLGK